MKHVGYISFSVLAFLLLIAFLTIGTVPKMDPLPDKGANFSCATCHAGGGFSELNPFGEDWKEIATPQGDEYVPDIANRDSDGDGFTNDEEFSAATHPGDPTSYPIISMTITATAGEHGSISPSGEVTVSHGEDQEFHIEPDEGYGIEDVLVDGVSIGAESVYTFENVTTGHTIEAIFAVVTGIKGDVNDDGQVRSNDAILALRIAAGLITPSDDQKWAADVNGDGLVRSNDAILILRKAAGLAAPSASAASASRQIAVMLPEMHGIAGESVTVPLKVDNTNGLAGGDIHIAYDSAVLRAVEVSSDSDMLLVSNVSEPGIVRIAFAGANRLNSKTVAEIRFHILADDVSPLRIKRVALYRPDALPIDLRNTDHGFSSWAMAPERSELLQNFPNPFNPETWIPYKLSSASEVMIRIYSTAGELVRELDLGYKPAGLYVSQDRAVYWDGMNRVGMPVVSGVYFYSIQAGDFASVRKLIVLR
jgi:hypothetical protein